MTESKKRQTSLGILQRLRQKGLPEREEKMESMFDSLIGSDGEDSEPEVESPEYELESPEEQEKKRKGPKLEPSKVDQFKKGFKSVF